MKFIAMLSLFLTVRCYAAEEAHFVSMDEVVRMQVQAQRPIARTIAKGLAAATNVEIVLLRPDSETTNSSNPGLSGSRRYDATLVGTALTRDPNDLKALAAAISAGILESDGKMAMCFDPHHALRYKDETSFVDIVICFTCRQGYLERGGVKEWFSITQKSQELFERVFAAHGLGTNQPNQSLEPMGIAVTPRADARGAPAIPMAHH
jgi:hypothetical protein